MKIRMLKICAGPDATLQPGQTVDVPDAFGKLLLDAGAAVNLEPAEVKREAASVERSVAVETATPVLAAERAVKVKPRK